MDFEKIKDAVKEIQFEETRCDDAIHLEAVIVKEELAKLVSCLESFFGSSVFPSKNKLSAKIQQDIKQFGGIMAGQTLYYWSEADTVIFAALWPWQDDEHITFKLIKK
jgi:hypothetical protein